MVTDSVAPMFMTSPTASSHTTRRIRASTTSATLQKQRLCLPVP